MDGEGAGTRDRGLDGLEYALGPGEGEEEATARAALLHAARGEDAGGGEGATAGGDRVDEGATEWTSWQGGSA